MCWLPVPGNRSIVFVGRVHGVDCTFIHFFWVSIKSSLMPIIPFDPQIEHLPLLVLGVPAGFVGEPPGDSGIEYQGLHQLPITWKTSSNKCSNTCSNKSEFVLNLSKFYCNGSSLFVNPLYSKKESFRKDNKTYSQACIVESANSSANYSATSNYEFKIFLAYY